MDSFSFSFLFDHRGDFIFKPVLFITLKTFASCTQAFCFSQYKVVLKMILPSAPFFNLRFLWMNSLFQGTPRYNLAAAFLLPRCKTCRGA